MVDGSLAHPFFLRDEERRRIKDNKPFKNDQNNKYVEYLVRLEGKEMNAMECDFDYF